MSDQLLSPVRPKLLVLACGALVKELQAIVALNDLRSVTVECLPADFHNRPERIAPRLRERLEQARLAYDDVLVGYADCGSGGAIDEVCAEFGVERLPGVHCYEFFATPELFAELHQTEIGTFYLTDYLARHFDRLVVAGLGIDRHPELEALYFGNYRRLVYLAQLDDEELTARAGAAAERLGLEFERRMVGYGQLEPTLVTFARTKPEVELL